MKWGTKPKPNPFAGPNGSTAYHKHDKKFIHTLFIRPASPSKAHANQHSWAVAWLVQGLSQTPEDRVKTKIKTTPENHCL